MDTIEILLIAAAVLVGIYAVWCFLFLYLVGMRRSDGRIDRYKSVKFAHRGLHDKTRAENSISAFLHAKEMGFGIEMDIRLSADGKLVVFHDSTLARVCGREGKVIDYTAEELGKMSLLGTSDGIPTLAEVLSAIDGAVPLLIEIKSEPGESGVAERLVEEIRDYHGEFIVESFNPVALRRVREARPDILIGILSCKHKKPEKMDKKILFSLLENLYMNFLMRPDFIAYEKCGYKNKNLRFLRRAYRAPLLAWTVCSEKEESEAIGHGFDSVIFEGYIPEK